MNQLTFVLALALCAVATSKSTVRGSKKGNVSDEDGPQHSRKLAEIQLTGECTTANFSPQVGGDNNLAAHLGVSVGAIQATLKRGVETLLYLQCKYALFTCFHLTCQRQ